MAETLTAPPPAAPAAAVIPAAPSPSPASASIPPGQANEPPLVKPTSKTLRNALSKLGPMGRQQEEEKKQPDAEPAKTEPKPVTEPPKPDAAEPGKAAPATTEGDGEPSAEYKAALAKTTMPPDMAKFVLNKDGKINPWKRAEWYEKQYVAQKDENTKLKTSSLAETEKAEYQKRIESAEKRVKEFEDDLRLTNYSKSQEFKEKFQQPYEKAWNRGMSELQGLTVANEDGSARAFNAQDMLQLVNMDTVPARKMANELYGDLANEVMLQRNEIRQKADEQSAAIEKAKVEGADREKLMTETQTRTQKEIHQHISQEFKAAHEASLKDPNNGRFFSEKEGDDEWNKVLTKGREFSTTVFAENPDNPRLSKEQRAEIVRKHNAVFNRSSAYGPMKLLVSRLEKQLAEANKELEGFKASRPDTSGTRAPATNGTVQHGKAIDRVLAQFPTGSR